MEEEGPVAYLNSRYVSHERHRHNLEPCPVRIDRNIEDWETSFRFVWEDHVDATAPVKILLVQPTPPLIVFQGTVGHILIVQTSSARPCCMCCHRHHGSSSSCKDC